MVYASFFLSARERRGPFSLLHPSFIPLDEAKIQSVAAVTREIRCRPRFPSLIFVDAARRESRVSRDDYSE